MLVNACACSLVLSIIAVFAFVVVDGYVRLKRTHKHKGMITGMGVFLCFILMQAAFTTGALSRQADFYEDLYNDVLDAAGYDDYNADAASATWHSCPSTIGAYGEVQPFGAW